MRTATTLLILSVAAGPASAQFGGNAGYGQAGGRARAEAAEQAKRSNRDGVPPSETSTFLDASILVNVKADAFVATYGVAEQAETIEGCHARMDATVAAFTKEVGPLGVGPESLFVDFAAQTKVYGFKIEGNIAREQLVGFELKKTIAIRFRDKALIDKLVVAASRVKVFDLIKVDYIVTDLGPIQDRLADEAAAVIKAKAARQERLLGIRLRAVPQVYAEKSSTYYPTELYDSYTAGESEDVGGGPDRNRMTVQTLRRSRTFFYNALDASGFDRVIDPVVLEPVVQFTLYLKLKYEIETRG